MSELSTIKMVDPEKWPKEFIERMANFLLGKGNFIGPSLIDNELGELRRDIVKRWEELEEETREEEEMMTPEYSRVRRRRRARR